MLSSAQSATTTTDNHHHHHNKLSWNSFLPSNLLKKKNINNNNTSTPEFLLVAPPHIPSATYCSSSSSSSSSNNNNNNNMSRMLSAASDVSTCSTLIGNHLNTTPPASPLMSKDMHHSNSHHHQYTNSLSPALFDMRHHHPSTTSKLAESPSSSIIHQDVMEDLKSDANMDTNERRARAAVRYALRNSRPLDRYRIDAIVGFGSNGVVLRATPLYHHHHHFGQVAIKIIYRSTNPHVGKPNEIALLDLMTKSAPHPNVLSHVQDWEDAKHFYLITQLHGGGKPSSTPSSSTQTSPSASPVPSLASFASPASTLVHDMDEDLLDMMDSPVIPEDQDDDSNAPLIFWNPRLARREHLSVSPGTTDLWTWSLQMSQRAFNPFFPRFTTPAVTYRLNPPPLPLARGIFAQVASGVAHLHSIGVSHGDLKEENILLDAIHVDTASRLDDHISLNPSALTDPSIAAFVAPTAMVCDFGHAATGHTHRVVAYGTREMTPPELLPNLHVRPPPNDTNAMKADVFALGMCLYSLLHGPGCLPVAVQETVRLGRGLSGGVYPVGNVRGDLTGDAREVLEGMLCVDPVKRWSMERVVGHKWVREVVEARRVMEMKVVE